jgi:hypothetical protein
MFLLDPIGRQSIKWEQIGNEHTEDAGLTTKDG